MNDCWAGTCPTFLPALAIVPAQPKLKDQKFNIQKILKKKFGLE